MKQEILLALVKRIVDRSITDIQLSPGPRGLRGYAGLDGNSFDLSEHIESILASIPPLKLSQEQIEELTGKPGQEGAEGQEGVRGPRGHSGIDGNDFSLEDHIEKIVSSIPPLELSEKQREELAGARGPRGHSGSDGNDFSIEDHIQNIIDALPPIKLSEEQRQSLVGPRGKQGVGFLWDENVDKITSVINTYIEENKSDLKLKFSDLNEEELFALKGDRGTRGQRGKQGDDGNDGIDGKDFSFNEEKDNLSALVVDNKEVLKLKFEDLNPEEIDQLKLKFESLTEDERFLLRGSRGQKGSRGDKGDKGAKGDTGKNGMRGIPGVQGVRGLNGQDGKDGLDGRDGLDAAEVEEISLDKNKDEISLEFEFTDGTRIKTNSVKLPKASNNTFAPMMGGGGGGSGSSGGGISEIGIEKDGVVVGGSENINFEGDNIDVTYDEITKTASVSVEETCIPVMDEGSLVTDCLKTINFVGDYVTVSSATKIADWAILDDVVPAIGSYEVANPGAVEVVIANPAEVPVPKLSVNKIYGESLAGLKLVVASSPTEVVSANIDSYNNARVFGITTEVGLITETHPILILGIVDDVSLNYPVNTPLFLGAGGDITDTPTTISGEFITEIGYSLGAGSIFISLSEPMEIL